MGDKYLELANSKIGKSLLSAVGLPEPVALQRESYDAPHRLQMDIRIGSSTDAAFTKQIKSILKKTDVTVLAKNSEDKSSLIFDASGISNVQESLELYQFFNRYLPMLSRRGRVLVIGHKPSAVKDPDHATLQSGLVGFIKSVAKEIGRKGATANLIYVDKMGEDALAAPLRFFLSAGSAFTNGQVINVSSPVGHAS